MLAGQLEPRLVRSSPPRATSQTPITGSASPKAHASLGDSFSLDVARYPMPYPKGRSTSKREQGANRAPPYRPRAYQDRVPACVISSSRVRRFQKKRNVGVALGRGESSRRSRTRHRSPCFAARNRRGGVPDSSRKVPARSRKAPGTVPAPGRASPISPARTHESPAFSLPGPSRRGPGTHARELPGGPGTLPPA